MIIKIKVTPYVKKIFAARYGHAGPFKIFRTDIVYHILQGDPVRVNKRFKKLRKDLTQTISLDVSATIYERLLYRQRTLLVGLYLHRFFIDQMLLYVEAQVMAQVPSQTSLKQYLAIHDVGEDDLALDTAYTAWKRRKAFFSHKLAINTRKKTQQSALCFLSENGDELPMPYDAMDLLQAVNDFYGCGFVNLLCRPIRVKIGKRAFIYPYDRARHYEFLPQRKILAFLLYEDGALRGEEICKIINLSFNVIYKYIRQVRADLDHYDDVKNDIEAIRRLCSCTN
jgi:hypothetical protein